MSSTPLSQEDLRRAAAAAVTCMDHARTYEDKRFASRSRMRRLDGIEQNFARRVFEKAGPHPRVLDLPCGSGRFFDVFRDADRLIMADLSESMLKVVAERYQLPSHVQLLQADVTQIPLPDRSVDLCFCMRLFHHLPSDAIRIAALRELARVSVKCVALSFYNRHSLRYHWRKMLGKKIRGNFLTFAHLADLAKEAGLEVEEGPIRAGMIEQQSLVILRKP